jgi:hypothetical protein
MTYRHSWYIPIFSYRMHLRSMQHVIARMVYESTTSISAYEQLTLYCIIELLLYKLHRYHNYIKDETKRGQGGLQLHYQIPPFSKLYNFSYRTWRYDFQSYDRQRQRQQESQEIATLLLPPHQHIQTVSHLLWSYIYNFVLAGAYIRSRASTCSQPTIGLQSQVANAPNMLDTSPWREKRSSTKLGEMTYLRVLPSPWLPSHDHCGASKNYCSAVVHTWLVPHKSTSGNGIFQ